MWAQREGTEGQKGVDFDFAHLGVFSGFLEARKSYSRADFGPRKLEGLGRHHVQWVVGHGGELGGRAQGFGHAQCL